MEKIKPTRWFYGLAAILIAVGGITAVVLVRRGFDRAKDNAIRLLAPCSEDVRFPVKGTYRFHCLDARIVGVDSGLDMLQPRTLLCQVRSEETGKMIPVVVPPANSIYYPRDQSRSLLECRIDRPGTYEVSAQYSVGEHGPHAWLMIENGLLGRIMFSFVWALAALVLTVGAAVAVILIVSIKRGNSKRRLRSLSEPVV